MSMYGDGESAWDKNRLFDEMRRFLENHSIDELLRIVADAVECSE